MDRCWDVARRCAAEHSRLVYLEGFMTLWIVVALAVGLAVGCMVPASAGLGRAERRFDRTVAGNGAVRYWVPRHAHHREAE